VANPDIADVVPMSSRDVVINAMGAGVTDVLVWPTAGSVRHYRVSVHAPADRMQILLLVKFVEVRRDILSTLGLSFLYRSKDLRTGTDFFRNDNGINQSTGAITLPSEGQFLTVLSDLGTDKFLGLLQAQADRGNARVLAEPNIMAGDRDEASFLAGGEIPIPVAQTSAVGSLPTVTIQYREFGVRLNFRGEIVSDSLVRLKVRPEVSSLDYTNAVELSGFRIPALRTRRIESTLDVRRDQSLIVSGLFNEEREKTRSGIPGLMDIPILGALFGSSSWRRNETELLVIVTPIVINPLRPRPQDIAPSAPTPQRPGADVLKSTDPSVPR